MKLSIIIPVYNQEELVIRCLNSIPKRDDIEIIVIDDASTDDTYKNLLKWFKIGDNFKLIKNDENIGAGLTRNIGIEEATGEYIMFLDSDDYLYPELDRFINELTGEDMIYYGLIENDGTKIMPRMFTVDKICGTVKAIRRKFVENSRFPNMRYAEDWHFNQLLLKRLPTMKFTKIFLLHYNHPRENSLCDIEMKRREKENAS